MSHATTTCPYAGDVCGCSRKDGCLCRAGVTLRVLNPAEKPPATRPPYADNMESAEDDTGWNNPNLKS